MPGNNVNIRAQTSGVKQAGSEFDQLKAKIEKLQSTGAKGLAIGAGAAITAKGLSILDSALSATGDFIGDATEAASSLNETMFKSKTVFGSFSDEMEAWAATGADAFGQSKRAALDAAAGYTGLFKTAGIELDKGTDMAKRLTELGSDLASMFDTDVADALEAIRSGLSGESEPLRRFNVFLNETAVSSKLVAMGQQKVNGQWTEGQKQLARYNLILEQTTDAQGVFGADANSLADAQRKQNAELENAQAILGQKFLPVALQVTKWQTDFAEGLVAVGGALGDAAEVFGDFANTATTALDVLTFWDKQTHFIAEVRLPEQDAAVYRSQQAVKTAADSIGVDARSMRQNIGDAASAMGDAEQAAEDLEAAIDDLTDAASDNAAAFGDQKFSAVELKGRMSELEQEIIDAKDELNNLKAIKDPTAEQRRDIAATRGRIAGMEHDLFDVRTELALLDGTGLDSLLKELGAAQYRTDQLGREAREALAAFQKLSFASGNVGGFRGDPGFTGRASGGPVHSGQTYLVGEKGPELLHMGGGSGNIVPNSKLGGGGTTINVNVNGGVITPAALAQIQNELGPAIADYLTRAGWSQR